MATIRAFDGISESDVKKMLNCFQAQTLHYKKDTTILSNVQNVTQVGIIMKGSADIIRYNYNGSRTIIDKLNEGDTFGSFTTNFSEDLYVVSKDEADVIFFDYSHLINRCKKNCEYHNRLVDNMVQILSQKLKKHNERIEILTKKTIREKLLTYFDSLSKKQISKIIILPFTLTDLADYLSIDRSAMMREIKNLKDDKLITTKGKKIYLNY